MRGLKVHLHIYLGVSKALGKDGAAGWLCGDRRPPPRPRAELYPNKGDWKDWKAT